MAPCHARSLGGIGQPKVLLAVDYDRIHRVRIECLRGANTLAPHD
jgi:hypothetical protein